MALNFFRSQLYSWYIKICILVCTGADRCVTGLISQRELTRQYVLMGERACPEPVGKLNQFGLGNANLKEYGQCFFPILSTVLKIFY